MSNLIDQNPLIFDTAAATVAVSSYLTITNIRWVDYNNDIADGDQAVVKDSAGKVIWEARITATGTGVPTYPQDYTDFVPSFQVKGLIISTLTHGKIYVYCDQKATVIPASA